MEQATASKKFTFNFHLRECFSSFSDSCNNSLIEATRENEKTIRPNEVNKWF